MRIRSLPEVLRSIGEVQGFQRLRAQPDLEDRATIVARVAPGLDTMAAVLRHSVGGAEFDAVAVEEVAREHADRVVQTDLRDAAMAAARLVPDAPHVALAVALSTTLTWMHHHGDDLVVPRWPPAEEILAWEVVPAPRLGWDSARVSAEREARIGMMKLPAFGWDTVPHALARACLAVGGSWAAADLAAHSARILGTSLGEFDPYVRPAWERYEALATEARTRRRDELALLAWRLRQAHADDVPGVRATIAALSFLLGRTGEWSALGDQTAPGASAPPLPPDFWVELVTASLERCWTDCLVQRAWLQLKAVDGLDLRSFPCAFGIVNCVYQHPMEEMGLPWGGSVADVVWGSLRAWCDGSLTDEAADELGHALSFASLHPGEGDLRVELFWELVGGGLAPGSTAEAGEALDRLAVEASRRLARWSFTGEPGDREDLAELMVAVAHDAGPRGPGGAPTIPYMGLVVRLQDSLRGAAGAVWFRTTPLGTHMRPKPDDLRERDERLMADLRGCRFILGLGPGMPSAERISWSMTEGPDPSLGYDDARNRIPTVIAEQEALWDELEESDPDHVAVRRRDDIVGLAARALKPAHGP